MRPIMRTARDGARPPPRPHHLRHRGDHPSTYRRPPCVSSAADDAAADDAAVDDAAVDDAAAGDHSPEKTVRDCCV